jgi:RNA polymerase sigma-70 factor (ECF subfamily)
VRRDAFARWVVPEISILLRMATSLTGQSADAEHLVQDTLIRAYKAVDRFDGEHPRAWLLTILRNTHINRVRRRLLVLFREPSTEVEQSPFGVEPRTPADLVVDGTFDAVVENALRTLPARFRQVVELVDVAGLSYAEAASVLQIPQGTVMSRLHRARNRMRAKLTAAGLAPRRSPMCGGCSRRWSGRTRGRWPSGRGRRLRTVCSGCSRRLTGTPTRCATTCAATSWKHLGDPAGVLVVDETGF